MPDEPHPVSDSLYTSIPSPVGELIATSDGDALTGLYPPTHTHLPDVAGLTRDDAFFAGVKDQLDAYFRERLFDFDIKLRPRGTPFQQAVWDRLRAIPCGVTRSYQDLALALGRPNACRAVGAAVGKNPISFVIPCHRVIGAGGTLTGYAGGVPLKRWLLEHETRVRLGAAYFERAAARIA